MKQVYQTVYDYVCGILSEIKGIQSSDLSKDMRFIEDIGMDSLSLIDFLIKIEEEYPLSLEQQVTILENLGTIDDFVRLLVRTNET